MREDPRYESASPALVAPAPERPPLALVVDDEPALRRAVRRLLVRKGLRSVEAGSYGEALAAIGREPELDLALLDIGLPGGSGYELLLEIRRRERWVEVVMISGQQDIELVRRCLRAGAFDYLVKPFDPGALGETVDRALERRRLLEVDTGYRRRLESVIDQQTRQLKEARDVAMLTLARLAESRDPETGRHLERIADYTSCLWRLLRQGPYRGQSDPGLEERVRRTSVLHDIGKVAIPDSILLKPGPLTADEAALMQTHAAVGGDILKRVRDVTHESDFLDLGMRIAYQHHEKWDGSGYPQGLIGQRIDLPARVVAVVDAYDALTSRRPYKEPVDHLTAVSRIAADRGRHFDPAIVDAFLAHAASFDRIRRRLAG